MFESLGLEIWHVWLLAGCAIAVLELVLLGSYYLLAVAGGAMLVGIAAAIVPLSLTMQWFVFAVATALVALLMQKLRSPEVKQVADDASYLVGSLVEVVEAIAPRGRVMYKSVTWAAESADILAIGEHAVIEKVNGSTLHVKKITTDEKEVS